MAYNNNIHIAILGPVSAGKSTFLNALFSNTFSDMKRKKTTMLPQIYQTTLNDSEINTTEEIYNLNHESNEKILKLREENKYTQADFKELNYKVAPIPDFITLPDKTASYSILDMPGLNCGGGDNMYFNYIQSISKKIDIYILVFDINSGLNTTDEVNILQMISKEIEKNKLAYVHILINKCDDVEYNGNIIKFNDEELQDLYDRCVETANKYLKDVRGNVSISPLCSSDLYVFRGIKNNIDSIDEKHLDKIIMSECGKKELNKLKTVDLKRKYIIGLIREKESTMYSDWMKDTGYNMFQENLDNILSIENYVKIVEHHILQNLMDILALTINDFDIVSSKLELVNLSIKQLSTVVPKYVVSDNINTIINSITLKINDYLNKGIDSYTASTVEIADTFLSKIGKFWGNIKNLFSNNPFEQSQTKLMEKRISLLNLELSKKYNPVIFKELIQKKMLNVEQFKECIKNTLKVDNENPYITNIMINLIKSIYNVSKFNHDNIDFIDLIITRFTELPISYMFIDNGDDDTKCIDKPEYHSSFLNMLKVIKLYVSDKDKIIAIVLNCLFKYFKPSSVDVNGKVENMKSSFTIQLNLANHWISTHFIEINKVSEISYIYYKLKFKLENYGAIISFDKINTINYTSFVNMNNRMMVLFNTLCEIFEEKKQEVEVKSNLVTSAEECEKQSIPEQEAKKQSEFMDAENHDETSDEYNDSDDPTTVYKKATHNAKVRMNKTLKKGEN
jgi:GTPase SAR1 family protein